MSESVQNACLHQDCRKNNRIRYPQPPAECINSTFADVKSQRVYIILKKMLFEKASKKM